VTKTRIAALVGLVIAAAVGTIFDRHPQPSEVKRAGNGWVVLSGDFHVHAFVGDGGLAPWELPVEAARRNLDVIAVTNHNQMLAARIASRLSPRGGAALVIEGQEITAPRYHMIAVGVSQTVDWRLSAADAAREVHRQGGVAIAAHPVPTSWRSDSESLRAIDGAEAAHPLIDMDSRGFEKLQTVFRPAQSLNPDLAPIGSTDFHFSGPMGMCRTYVFATDRSREAVITAIAAGRTVATDMHGRLTGDPELVREVERLFPAPGKSPQPDRVSTMAAALAVASLFALVVLR
jgi:hypothetical protein